MDRKLSLSESFWAPLRAWSRVCDREKARHPEFSREMCQTLKIRDPRPKPDIRKRAELWTLTPICGGANSQQSSWNDRSAERLLSPIGGRVRVRWGRRSPRGRVRVQWHEGESESERRLAGVGLHGSRIGHAERGQRRAVSAGRAIALPCRACPRDHCGPGPGGTACSFFSHIVCAARAWAVADEKSTPPPPPTPASAPPPARRVAPQKVPFVWNLDRQRAPRRRVATRAARNRHAVPACQSRGTEEHRSDAANS